MEPVNAACCDAGRDTCEGGGSGVPTVCDVKCAMSYSPFYDDCERALRLSFDPSTMAAFSGLATTCDTLPVSPLLRSLAAAECPATATGAPEPSPETPQRFGGWLDTAFDCSLAQLKAHASEVDTTCCTDESGNCADGPPSRCLPECGGKLLSMYVACSTTLNLVFDGIGDGVYDGTALMLFSMRSSCLQLPAGDVIEAIQDKIDAGCTLQVEGVGETAVSGGGSGATTGGGDDDCADSDKTLCQMVGQGLLHCSADFCPDCAHSGECDRTCGFCEPTHGNGRRRGQIIIATDPTCPPAEFAQRTNAVNDACCDVGNAVQCAAGVPTSCDARCALTWNVYYSECQHMITALMDPGQLVAFEQLNHACASLPASDLLTALGRATCDAAPAVPAECDLPFGGCP